MSKPADRAIALLEERKAVGLERYERLLSDDDPRDMGREADEEMADWLIYWMAYREQHARRVEALVNERERLRRQVEAQAKAMVHWQREADLDAGKIARYEAALRRIEGTAEEMPGAIQIAIRAAREALGE